MPVIKLVICEILKICQAYLCRRVLFMSTIYSFHSVLSWWRFVLELAIGGGEGCKNFFFHPYFSLYIHGEGNILKKKSCHSTLQTQISKNNSWNFIILSHTITHFKGKLYIHIMLALKVTDLSTKKVISWNQKFYLPREKGDTIMFFIIEFQKYLFINILFKLLHGGIAKYQLLELSKSLQEKRGKNMILTCVFIFWRKIEVLEILALKCYRYYYLKTNF